MRKIISSTSRLVISTLSILLLMVAACENDDAEIDLIDEIILKFHLSEDLNVVVGESATFTPTDSTAQLFNPPAETLWFWRLLSQPDGSQAVLENTNKVSASLKADVQGEYQIELFAALEEQVVIDTLVAYAHKVSKLTGTYQPLFETNGDIIGLHVYQDKLYAYGYFSIIGGVKAYGIAAYDGTTWSPLGSGLTDDQANYGGAIYDMIEYQGELYVTGGFGNPGGTLSPAIARWNGEQWVEVPGVDRIIGEGGWYLTFKNYGYSFEIFRNELYIVGNFQDMDPGLEPFSIMKWDGSQLTGVPTDLNLISDMTVFNNHLYVQGYIGEYARNNLSAAAFDGSVWNTLDIEAQIHPENPDYTTRASNPSIVYRNKIYHALHIDTETYRTSELAVWHAAGPIDYDTPFSRSAGNTIYTLEVINNTLYIGGEFHDLIVGTKSNGMVIWDGEKWGLVANGNASSISAIREFQNKLFVAGNFDGSEKPGSYNYRNTNQIAIWQP